MSKEDELDRLKEFLTMKYLELADDIMKNQDVGFLEKCVYSGAENNTSELIESMYDPEKWLNRVKLKAKMELLEELKDVING